MGFSISWVAFQGIGKDEVLRRVGMRDTGALDEANEAPFSIAELATGWVVIFSSDFGYGAPERLCALSRAVTVVSCQVEERAMVSAVSAVVDGAETFRVWHDGGQRGTRHLEVAGEPPPAFGAIRDRLFAEQTAEDEGDAEVDHVFDIPVEVAEDLTGYRHDRWQFEWGEPRFTALVPRAPFGLSLFKR